MPDVCSYITVTFEYLYHMYVNVDGTYINCYIIGNTQVAITMKHYRAKPSAQLSKYLQDDIKRAVMKLELE